MYLCVSGIIFRNSIAGLDSGYGYVVRIPVNQKDSGENNERFEKARKLKAFVVYDPKKAADDKNQMMSMVHDMELRLEGTRPRDPEKVYRDLPAFVRRYLDYSVDGRGVMHMVRKDNAFTFADNRSGMFVMLTSADTTFDEVMTSYDVRIGWRKHSTCTRTTRTADVPVPGTWKGREEGCS